MESYKLDRIYTWLSSALGFNQEAEKKYFYDRNEKLFFNLGFKGGQYFVWTNQIPLTDSDRAIVTDKISRVTLGDSAIIDIVRASTNFQYLPQKQAKSPDEYREVEKEWKELYQEVQSFLKRNDINIYETVLIE